MTTVILSERRAYSCPTNNLQFMWRCHRGHSLDFPQQAKAGDKSSEAERERSRTMVQSGAMNLKPGMAFVAASILVGGHERVHAEMQTEPVLTSAYVGGGQGTFDRSAFDNNAFDV